MADELCVKHGCGLQVYGNGDLCLGHLRATLDRGSYDPARGSSVEQRAEQVADLKRAQQTAKLAREKAKPAKRAPRRKQSKAEVDEQVEAAADLIAHTPVAGVTESAAENPGPPAEGVTESGGFLPGTNIPR